MKARPTPVNVARYCDCELCIALRNAIERAFRISIGDTSFDHERVVSFTSPSPSGGPGMTIPEIIEWIAEKYDLEYFDDMNWWPGQPRYKP